MSVAAFVARQPVFDQLERVFGYELLFRSSVENVFQGGSPDRASVTILDKFLTLGSKTLADGRRAFINCTRDFLLREYATLLPRKRTVLEILETVEADSQVLAVCRKLKDGGYVLALDDFSYTARSESLIEIADFIKVDFLTTPVLVRQRLVDKFAPLGIRMLAEKVETRADFDQARRMGYEYFQGYFFCKPQMLCSRELPAYKLHYLQLLQAIAQPELDVAELERVLHCDASLCYKLLRYVNSAAFGFRSTVASVRHALALLGEREVKKWAAVVAILEIAQDRPPELLVASLTRARCCERLASKIGMRSHASEFFLVGLFSLMDAIMGRPARLLFSEVALPQPVKAALLGENNTLRKVHDLVVAYDQGAWDEMSQQAARLRLDESSIPDAYATSLEWATKVFEV